MGSTESRVVLEIKIRGLTSLGHMLSQCRTCAFLCWNCSTLSVRDNTRAVNEGMNWYKVPVVRINSKLNERIEVSTCVVVCLASLHLLFHALSGFYNIHDSKAAGGVYKANY